jgi:hypothetical protein
MAPVPSFEGEIKMSDLKDSEKVEAFLIANPGATERQISETLGISRRQVRKYLPAGAGAGADLLGDVAEAGGEPEAHVDGRCRGLCGVRLGSELELVTDTVLHVLNVPHEAHVPYTRLHGQWQGKHSADFVIGGSVAIECGKPTGPADAKRRASKAEQAQRLGLRVYQVTGKGQAVEIVRRAAAAASAGHGQDLATPRVASVVPKAPGLDLVGAPFWDLRPADALPVQAPAPEPEPEPGTAASALPVQAPAPVETASEREVRLRGERWASALDACQCAAVRVACRAAADAAAGLEAAGVLLGVPVAPEKTEPLRLQAVAGITAKIDKLRPAPARASAPAPAADTEGPEDDEAAAYAASEGLSLSDVL